MSNTHDEDGTILYGRAWRLLRLMCTHDETAPANKVADLMVTLCEITGIDIDVLAGGILDWGFDNPGKVAAFVNRRRLLEDENLEEIALSTDAAKAGWDTCMQLVSDDPDEQDVSRLLAKVAGRATKRRAPVFTLPAFRVKVKIGLFYDFSDLSKLLDYMTSGRIVEDDVISRDGVEWTRIGDIDDLEVYLASEENEEEEEELYASLGEASRNGVGDGRSGVRGSGRDDEDPLASRRISDGHSRVRGRRR